MKHSIGFARAFARVSVCALACSFAPAALFAQTAAEPAESVTDLPAVEVQAGAAKKTAAPKQSATPVSEPSPAPEINLTPPMGDIRPTGIANPGPVVDYVAGDSNSATKTNAPLKETPQSISVVGQEQMRDQGVQNLQEALRYMPGVVADSFGYDSRYDNSIVRGIAATHYIDGLRTTYGYGSSSAMIEPYALERVEVLRGPSSMLYGQTPTGGLINAVSKLPSEIPYGEIGVDYGSFDFKQVRLDMTGPLTQDGKWLYRIVGLARDADTQVDFVENDRLMLAPSLTYRPTNDTSITVLGTFRDDQSGSTQQFYPHAGTLTPNVNGQRVRQSAFAGEPGDYYDTEQQSVTAIVDHKFSEDLALHHVSRYAHTETDYDSTYAAPLSSLRLSALNFLGGLGYDPSFAPFLDANQTQVARSRTVQFTDAEVFNSDTNLTGTFSTGDLHHKMTGGFDYMRFRANVSTSGPLLDNLIPGVQSPFDIYNPIYGQTQFLFSPNALVSGGDPFVPANAIPMDVRPEETQTQAGIYLQDQLRWGPWLGVVGVRQDWLTIEEDGSPDIDEAATTWRAALMYEFDSGFSPYVSYSTSFMPVPGQVVGPHMFTDFLGAFFGGSLSPAGPVEGEQVEVGFKYQPAGAPFMINAALYELTEKNQVVQPDYFFDAVQGADVKVRGFEIEAVGKVTEQLKVIGSYSYTDATYEKYPELFPSAIAVGFPDLMKGKRVDGVPQHLASLWALYSVDSGMFKGLSFGGGVRYVGSSESFGVDVELDATSGLPIVTGERTVKTPSFTLFDAMIAYETEDWRWQITGQNLADKYHVVSCSVYRGDCGVGQGRTIVTGFTYKF